MSNLVRQFRIDASRRHTARRQFDSRLAVVRQDIAARSVAGRLADKVATRAREASDEAIAIADENRGVIGGTIAVLMVWFLRHPLLAVLGHVLGGDDDENSDKGREP